MAHMAVLVVYDLPLEAHAAHWVKVDGRQQNECNGR
eukprot:SAG31_NODE_409_length_16006_cov_10.345760_7_plen_36_part_00